MAYTFSQLRTDVTSRLHNKIGRVTSPRDAINAGVRKATATPLKTLRRRYPVPVRILDTIFDFTAPSDIMGHKVIDLVPVIGERPFRYQWKNVSPSVFDRLKGGGSPVLSVNSNGSSRILKATISGNDQKAMISEMDTITDGGTWTAVGTASDLTTDSTYFVYGSGSIKFDIGAGTQDGIDATLTTAVDIDDYRPDGSAYWSVSLPSISGVTGVTLQLGSDSSNYLELSATSDIAGNSIVSGFNLFGAKLSDGTETGTPDYENIDYVAVLIDKDTTTLSGVRADRIIVGSGSQHMLEYYSRFGWRTSSGTWIENSTADTDILNAEQEEYDLVVEYCVAECSLATREYQDADRSELKIKEMKRAYQLANPDCSIRLTSDSWRLSSTSKF